MPLQSSAGPAPVRKLHAAFERKNQNRLTFNASSTTLNSLPLWLAADVRLWAPVPLLKTSAARSIFFVVAQWSISKEVLKWP